MFHGILQEFLLYVVRDFASFRLHDTHLRLSRAVKRSMINKNVHKTYSYSYSDAKENRFFSVCQQSEVDHVIEYTQQPRTRRKRIELECIRNKQYAAVFAAIVATGSSSQLRFGGGMWSLPKRAQALRGTRLHRSQNSQHQLLLGIVKYIYNYCSFLPALVHIITYSLMFQLRLSAFAAGPGGQHRPMLVSRSSVCAE